MKTGLKALGLGTALSLLTGCVSMDNYSDNRTATKITNDAVRLNEAFNRSTNAVILKNVLRARDRWTVNFTTLSGITSSPGSKISGSMGFSPLGLGNAVGPFTGSNAELVPAVARQMNIASTRLPATKTRKAFYRQLI